MRVTKQDLEHNVKLLNDRLKDRGIDKEYEIGYRNGYTYLDQKSKNAPGCIVGNSYCGTKKEILSNIYLVMSVLY